MLTLFTRFAKRGDAGRVERVAAACLLVALRVELVDRPVLDLLEGRVTASPGKESAAAMEDKAVHSFVDGQDV